MSNKVKTLLKIIVTIALVTFLLTKSDLQEIYKQLLNSNVQFFVYGILFVLATNLTQVIRWFFLLGNKKKTATFFDLLTFHSIGIFFQMFLPSSISGDIVKAHKLSKITGGKVAYSSIIVGKIIGVLIPFAIFLYVAIFGEDLFEKSLVIRKIAIFMSFAFIMLILFMSKKVSRTIYKIIPFLENLSVLKKIDSLKSEMYNYRYQKQRVFVAVLFSILIQLFTISATYFFFLAVGFNIEFIACVVVAPIIFIILIIPISINGLGVKEFAFMMFYKDYGITKEYVLSSSLLTYIAIYGISLMGGLFFALSKNKKDIINN